MILFAARTAIHLQVSPASFDGGARSSADCNVREEHSEPEAAGARFLDMASWRIDGRCKWGRSLHSRIVSASGTQLRPTEPGTQETPGQGAENPPLRASHGRRPSLGQVCEHSLLWTDSSRRVGACVDCGQWTPGRWALDCGLRVVFACFAPQPSPIVTQPSFPLLPPSP